MVKFDGDLTNPPSINTSSIGKTAKDWAGFAVVAGMAFAVLGIARSTVQPTLESALSMIPGVQTEGEAGGPWEGW